MTDQELEHHAQRVEQLKKLKAPVTMGVLVDVCGGVTKALGQKLRQRDARIAALEARVEKLAAQVTTLTGERAE